MAKYYDTWWKKALILLWIVLIRESGALSLSLHYNIATTELVSGGAVLRIGSFDSEDLTVTIRPHPLDYVPFYKSRRVRGSIAPATAGSTQALEAEVDLTVIGLCTGREFRRLAQARILDQALRQGPL